MKNVTRLLFSKLMILFVLSTMLFTQVGRAEVVVTIGTGTYTSQYQHPFYTYYEDGRSQYIYLASEMTGLIAGPITKLDMNFYSAGTGYPMAGFYLKMQNTTMTYNQTAFVESGWTDVYYNPSYVIPGTGWQTFVFNLNNFIWDGTSNIIVQVCWDNDAYLSNSYGRVYMTSQSQYRAMYRYTDNVAGCSVAASYVSYYRPNIKLYQPSPATMTGTVTSGATGLPVVGAVITGPYDVITTSGGGGAYTLPTFEGTFDYTCTYPGFLLNTANLTIPAGGTVTQNWVMLLPPTIQGTVTNAANGNPIKGATIIVEGEVSPIYTIQGGTYTQLLSQANTLTVTCSKAGFDSKSLDVDFPGGTTVTVDFALNETANKATQPFTAVLNTGNTAVNLNWGLPIGYYELIYDDGIKDLTTVWALGGNMNAMKFTGLNYPIRVYKGTVHIGDATDYPAGTDPSTLAPFQLQLYDATGTGGMPGNPLGDPMDIQPTHFGWIEFTLPAVQYIGSGNFYLVMTQGGNSDVAARLGVDNSSNNLRSFSRFVTSGGPWLPADGNFMMRLVVRGQGGPLTDLPEGIVGYQVWRLLQGNESLPGTWNSVATPTVNSAVDNSWPSVPDSAFRWAVKVQYTGARWSNPIFSNALGKNRTANVVVNVALTCTAHPLNGSLVTLTSMAPVEDSVYTAITDATGKVTFPKVWKAPYKLTVNRSGYETYSGDVSIYGDRTFDVTVLMQKAPPYNMYVEDVSLLASWNPPSPMVTLLNEDWESASFVTNGWTNSTGYWELVAGAGNPGYAAEIYYSWMLTNYDNVNLDSRTISGSGSPDFKLHYDIYLSDYAGDGNEYMTVEIAEVGQPWVLLKEYNNVGNIAWTTEIIDIAAYTDKIFQIRFRCHGADMYNINYWDIDNIKVVVTVPDPSACILAYNVYLNTILDGVTVDTFYNIPPNHVAYGQPYHACVKAVYGSGYSTESCYDFISKFLYPPTNLVADSVECVAYLTWVKPAMAGKLQVPAFKGTIEHTPSFVGRVPDNLLRTNASWPAEPSDYKGATAFGMDGSSSMFMNFDVNNLPGMTDIAPLMSATWWCDIEFTTNQPDWAYVITVSGNNLWTVDRATGAYTNLGSVGASEDINDLATDPTSGLLYAVSANGSLTADNLWLIDPSGPSSTLIGPTINSAGIIGLAFDGDGNLWGYDLVNDQFYSIDKTTGVATSVGSIGFNANYGQGMFYDPESQYVTMAAYNATSGAAEIRAVDVTTGASVVLSSDGDQIAGASLPIASGGGDPPGLIGYIVYRDGPALAQIWDKEITEYYDYTVEPGIHNYEVSAYYDLEPYGFPGLFGESLLEGPDPVDIVCGIPLPFFEPWDMATFEYQGWAHEGNWTVSSSIGNPFPSADFGWLPATVDYDQSLTTPTLNAGPYSCAEVWLDFDYKLVDRNATGDEYLTVELYKNGAWSEVAEYSNNGDVNWSAQHLKLKQTAGKAFKVRWRAHGDNSQDILHWYVDNVSIYAICTPPTSLAWYDINNKDVYLSWTPPECVQETPFTIIWDDDSYESGWTSGSGERWYGNAFPLTAGTAGYVTQLDVMFNNMDGSASPITVRMEVWDETHTMVGYSDDFTQQEDVWQQIAMPNVAFSGTFYGFAYLNNTGTRPYYCSLDTDGPNAYLDYGIRYDGSAWQTIGTYGGTAGVFLTRAHGMLAGKDGKSFTIEPGMNPNSEPNPNPVTNSPEMAIGKGGPNHPSGSGLMFPTGAKETTLAGYMVYRSDDFKVTYNPLFATPITDTTYADLSSKEYQDYYYFVTAVFSDQALNPPVKICESDSSNIILVPLVDGIDDQSKGSIMVYPNPATENVNVKSDYTISQIEVLNYIGQTVYNKTDVKAKMTKIDVAHFQTGVYFVKVTTEQGVRTVKITVTK